ncbi:hypothetical protein FOCC_FOCC016570 [Frankliniella occidentalis]|nr:hypothetical protein FOCC_FOCC016570 [Frankliniella occidentalis]
MVANVWYHLKDFGILNEWHFFATSHGKSACDGIGGTIKRLATYYAKQHKEPGSQITSARRLFEWAQSNVKGICTLWVSTQEVAAVERELKNRFDSAYKIDGIKSSHSVIPSQQEPSVTIIKYSKAAVGVVRNISTAEDQTLKFTEVRGYIIFWDQQEPKWYLGYVNRTNEETGVISIEPLVNKKKFEYEFQKDKTTDILFSQVLSLANPSITSRGRVIKLKAADAKTADALLNEVKPTTV